MNYLEAVAVIRQIEEKYDVMSIKYKGVSVWPFLRLYLQDQISLHTEIRASGSVVAVVLKSLFAYNPFQIFKRHKLWVFTGCERRKRIGGKMIHRVSGGIPAVCDDYLMIEKPNKEIGHFRRAEIEEKYIVSEAWLLILFHFLEIVLSPIKLKIENESLLKQILSDNNLTFDYKHYIHSLNAKRLSMLFLINLTHKPKLAIMECPYDSMGYMWAFHQKGVKVIEMQHGVLGHNHNAYNAISYEEMMNPDGICVYGNEEYKYFTVEKTQYAPHVYMTGLYMLEKADRYFDKDIFADYRKAYRQIMVCSGQSGYEEAFSAFIDKIAQENPDILFLYIPRLDSTKLDFMAQNVKLVRNVNIYSYLKWADCHMTISSTTCLEAQYFHTPTIFYDYERRASEYYDKQLSAENGAFYVNDASEFNSVAKDIDRTKYSYAKVFEDNHTERIKKIVNEYIQ